MILAIDPGLNAAGWALLHLTGQLHACGLLRPLGNTDQEKADSALSQLPAVPGGVSALVVELPQVYRPSRSKGSPKDLVRLAAMVGVFEARFPNAVRRRVSPHDWKGTLPKATIGRYIVHLRNRKALATRGGLDRYDAAIAATLKSLAHNAADAVGIALHYWRTECGQ